MRANCYKCLVLGGLEWSGTFSANMKTIESLHGLASGANATQCCIYCLQKKNKSIITTEVVARAASQKRTPTWEGGLFASGISSKPISLKTSIGRWKHVLPIPLERVHICTLHAFNCICEKSLHLHFQHVWTNCDKINPNKDAISDIETILSATGMHGGVVKIFKDLELFGFSNRMPNKSSSSGADATKLFPKSSHPTGSDRVWMDVVLAEQNNGDDGRARHDHKANWAAVQSLVPTSLI